MANNKTTYVLEIDAEVGQLKSKLESTKAALNKLGDSSFSVGMGKKITSILTQLEKLQKKASQPIDSKATFSSLEKGFGSIVVDAKNLLGELEKISSMVTREKLSLLPEDEAKKLKEALGAVQAYTKAVEKAEKARIRSQERRKGEREVANTQLGEAKETHKKAKAAYAGATAKGTEYGDAKAIVAQAEAAKKAQKEIDSLEKQLKKYQKRLEELNGIENRTEEQEAELQTTRSNVKSVGGKIGARKKIVKNAPDEKTLTAANKTIEEQTPAVEALELSVAQAAKEITRLENALTKLDEAIKNNSTEITSSQADYKILYEQAKKLGVSLEGVTEDVNPTNVRILTERMRDLVNEGVKPLDDAIEEVTPDIKELGDVATQTGEKISRAEEHFGSMVDNQSRINNLKENIKQFIGWAGASKVLSAAMRNAFQDIKELDKAMTEIAVVTDFDIGDMWDQMPQYTERANELGLAITEVYEASALFYQQGLDTNEMIALSNETLKMAKIAGLDAAEATDRMTAALRGFNMELDEASAQKVADVYSELAAITASDVDEISSAMTKTASIASSAGMEFETTAAFLSQIIETTRESAETAGTAMKTVIARFQELKKSPDEIGEIDGEIVDANAIEGALRSVGVSLRDAGGQFRELDDVFLELSSKWDGLDKNTQRYIATIAAGSRQQSRFIAMMSNYARTQELVTAANNSAGASQKQYEKTMESIETKLKQLDNAWTEFSTGLLNSDLVKFAVDFLTSLLNALNRVTQGFEGFTGSLSKIGTLVAIFQTAKTIVSKFFDEIIAKIYTSAVGAGENLAQGVKDGIDNKNGVKDAAGRMSSYSQMKEGASLIQKSKQIKIGDSAQVQAYRNQKSANIEKRKGIENRYEQAIIEAGPNVAKIREAENKRLEELAENEKELIEIEENRYYTQEEANEMSKQGFKNIAQGAQTAAQAITMVGVGLGVVGQMFKEAGLEEVGEGFQSAGNIITFVGSALMAIVPIISLLGTTFTVAGKQISLAGLMAQAGWWPLLLIGLAIAAVVTTIILVADAIKKASPEYKLEQAQKAADKAADAADRATKSYENLVSTFEELDAGYEALKDLTRGTEEWNKAVKNINNSVLDLIEQYPELAKFVDNEAGVLTIDMEDSNVQQILKDAEASAVIAQNSATVANLSVAKAEDDLAYKNLDDQAKFDLGGANAAYGGAMARAVGAGAGAGAGIGALVGTIVPGIGNAVGAAVGARIGAIGGLIGGFFTGEAAKDAALEDTQNQTEALAKAIADGAIIDNGSGYDVKDKSKLIEYGVDINRLDEYYAQVGDSTEALRDFGEQLLQTSAQEEAAFAAVAASAYQLANVLGMTEQEQAQASNVVDDASVKKMYDENMAELADIDFTAEDGSDAMTGEQKKMRDDAIRAQYGAGARIEGNKVTFRDAEGNQKTEELTNDEIKAIIANDMTTRETAKAIEIAPETIDHVISAMGFSKDSAEAKAIEIAALDQEGGNLTADQASTLANMNEKDLRKIYGDMSEEQKNVFGSEDEYIKKIKGAGEIAVDAFENAGNSAEKIGLTLSKEGETAAERFANTFGFMTSDMAEGFTKKMEEVYEISGEQGVQQVQAAYEKMLEGKDDETAQKITARMNAVDWTDQEQLNKLKSDLIRQYGMEEGAVKELIASLVQAAKATSDLTILDDTFGRFHRATKRVEAALDKVTELQWKYERMLNNGADTLELSTNLEEQRANLLKAGNEAIESYKAAREEQNAAYAEGVNWKGMGIDLTDYVTFNPNTGMYDYSGLSNLTKQEGYTKGTANYDYIMEYQKYLDEYNEKAQEQIDIAKDSYEKLEDLEQTAKESYQDLWEQVSESLVSEMEEQIAIQQSILDATIDANDRLVNKIQEQIDAERESRENEKTEEELTNLQNRMAYLGMDTSGANELQLLELEKQYAEQEQAYQDNLIDQSIQELQDANEKAAEQRERQIAIAEQQLEAYKLSEDHQNDVGEIFNDYMEKYEDYESDYAEWQKVQDAKNLTPENFKKIYGEVTDDEIEEIANTIIDKPTFRPEDTELGQLMVRQGVLEGMNELQKNDFWQQIRTSTANAAYYIKTLDEYSRDTSAGQKYLLDQITQNTSVDKLVEVLWGDRIQSANNTEKWFASMTGEGGFQPDIIKNNGTADYNNDTNLMGQHTSLSQNAYTEGNASALVNSDQQGNIEFSKIAPYISSKKTTITSVENGEEKQSSSGLLSKEEFYKNVNAGKSVGIGGYDFSAETLANSLANGTKAQVDGKDYIAGSYEHYMALAKKEYSQVGSSGQSEIDAGKSSKRTQLETNAVSLLQNSINAGTFTGFKNLFGTEEFKNLFKEYEHASGNKKHLIDNILAPALSNIGSLKTGFLTDLSVSDKFNFLEMLVGSFSEAEVKGPDDTVLLSGTKDSTYLHTVLPFGSDPGYTCDIPWVENNKINWIKGETDAYSGTITYYQYSLPINNSIYDYLKKYKTGGLADFTGPAWLDGTPSRPEYILNAAQTERFFSLIDVLEGYDTNNHTSSSGDNYFEIEINVEKIEDDYDVEQIANKIRSMIYEDATYRNVNAINQIH